MRYIVHSQKTIQTIKPSEQHIIISISDSEDGRPPIPQNSTCAGVLRCTFHDVNHTGYDPNVITWFSRDIADTILDFWVQHQDVTSVYVHCAGGQCRSPGVAAALQRLETGDDEHWFTMKNPNRFVYRLLLEQGYGRNLHKV